MLLGYIKADNVKDCIVCQKTAIITAFYVITYSLRGIMPLKYVPLKDGIILCVRKPLLT